jgi:ATP:cob(I)alamin adenosyltransferase
MLVLLQRRFNKIYTKAGDMGASSLFTGERRMKTDRTFDALGNTDELNSFIGLSVAHANEEKLREQLHTIQSRLLDIGGHIATPRSTASEEKQNRTQFSAENVTLLENWIDEYTSELPTIKQFILPGGSKCSAYLHVSRSVCRRTERSLIPLLKA